MSASSKIERLRNLWLGYAAFAVVIALLRTGFHREAIGNALTGGALMAGISWYFTLKLDKKSSLVWAFWVVGNVLCIGLAALQILSMFSEEGVFEILVLVRCAVAIAVHVFTFRTLRDADVKRHVMT
jgi:4-amino-4-deoxy-L-arabinose transferase-like glycosyltransferase